MSNVKVLTFGSTRKREAFCNPISLWKYKITTGSRCPGVESSKEYKSSEKALEAGNRMVKKLTE